MSETPPGRRGRTWLRVGAASAAVLVAALGGVWLAREPIADHYIAQALQERGVAGRYRIVRIGPETQRIEDLVLGDPANPDLTADWVEVDLGYRLFGLGVKGLRAGGVRLKARYEEGKFSLGALDKLMGESSGTAPALPDIVVAVEDSRADLVTDYGAVSASLSGMGNLQSGFAGKLGLNAPVVTLGGCRLDKVEGPLDLTTIDGRFALKGPVTAQALACADSDIAVAAPRIDADFRADPAMSDLSGAFALSADSATQGARALEGLSGLVTIKGALAQIEGNGAIAAKSMRADGLASGEAKFGGQFALRPGAGNRAFAFSPTLTLEDVRPTDKRLFARLTESAQGTPLAPLADRLVAALDEATQANVLTVTGRFDGDGDRNRLLVNGARFASASGARFGLAPGSELRADLAEGRYELRGTVEMEGGGLPEGKASFVSRSGGDLSGTLTLAEYRAGDARLGLTPVRFSRSRAGTISVRTQVALDGPLPDGHLSGLVVPVDVQVMPSGRMRFAQECLPLQWEAVKLSSLALDPARIDLCGANGDGLRLTDLDLKGRLGDSPLHLVADSAAYGLRDRQFDLAGLDVTIGGGENPVRLNAAALDGAVGPEGEMAGTFAQGAAVIGPVPLDLTDLAGDWTFADGRLGVTGGLRVSDEQTDARFEPLTGKDVQLALADGVITAQGTLVTPGRKVDVAKLDIRHDLSSGVGRADFTVDRLRFGNAVQPSDLTQLSKGIIALAEGQVDGNGQISWSSEGVTSSTGTFSTTDMNFAAAFGPVTGFSTTIEFTDLLNMRTAPHQRMTVRQVSAGVDVFDGVIDYQLLSNEQAVIESGHWPFSGGDLDLVPDTLNLDSRQPRRLSFRVRGMEAGAFINTLELENISATGIYDGILPIVFDSNGGRIEGGVLVARQQGLPPRIVSAGDPLPECDRTRQAGTLAYVGAVTNAETGMMARMAFDVLKNLSYRCLVIQLDGDLAGEFVTRVTVNGVNRGTEAARANFLTRPFVGLPFVFNVRIEAPFRGLMDTAASYSDPTAAVRNELNRQREEAEKSTLAVQPTDSDKALEGKME